MSWQPRYHVTKQEGVGGNPIPEDEPCIVIRGQDILAPLMMVSYIQLYQQLDGADGRVLDELRAHRTKLLEWQAQHPDAIKVADR